MPCLSLPRADIRWGLCSTEELRRVFPQRKALKYPLSSAIVHPPKRGVPLKCHCQGTWRWHCREGTCPGAPQPCLTARSPSLGTGTPCTDMLRDVPLLPRQSGRVTPSWGAPLPAQCLLGAQRAGAAQPVPPALGTPSWEHGGALGEHWGGRRSFGCASPPFPIPPAVSGYGSAGSPAGRDAKGAPQPPGLGQCRRPVPERVPGAEPPLAGPPGSRRAVPRGARGLAVTEPSPSRHRARLPPLHPFDVRGAQVPSAPQPAPAPAPHARRGGLRA